MQNIGILGGFGPQATMDLEARIHQIAQRLIPQQANAGYPSLMVYYHRHAPIVVNDNGAPIDPIQPDPRLLDAARRMGAWADLLVIVSNGAHVIQREIEQAADRPVLSMIDVTLAEIERRRIRRVGALGLFGPRIYQQPLDQIGVACSTIDADLQQRLDQAIFAVMEGRAAETYAVGRDVIAALRATDVEAIILGCTEIPFMLPEWQADPTLINPTHLLAEATVRAAID